MSSTNYPLTSTKPSCAPIFRSPVTKGFETTRWTRFVAPWTGDAGQPAFYRQIAQYDEQYLADNEARLGELKIPVHVVWGADDTWIPPQTGRRLAKLTPGT
jgi:pimeloyl-ACP methyl ester carboxylesterase